MSTDVTAVPAPAASAQDESATVNAEQKQLLNLVFRSMKRTADLFANDYAVFPGTEQEGDLLMKAVKRRHEYGHVVKAAEDAKKKKEAEMLSLPSSQQSIGSGSVVLNSGILSIGGPTGKDSKKNPEMLPVLPVGSSQNRGPEDNTTKAMLPAKAPMMVKPKWHAPWKLYRVISGHTGWVRAIDVEPENQWFVTGGADRIVKIWDLFSGKLRISLTGHVSSVRAVKVSYRNPFLFSAGEDKQVKCWDLEYNKVIRHYHGHLSAVQSMALHPTLDILVTCARDSTARVWDMRTKAQIHCLGGHTNTVADVLCQASDPQVITASHDSTIRLWDLAAGRSMCTLTHHKKSVRALTWHPRLNMFASASPDNIKQWKCPNGEFMQNLPGHNAIVNSIVCNDDGVLVSGGDNGSLNWWDWRSGFCFQKEQTKPQPGSIDSESGIYAMTFDRTGTRLLTAEADKTIKCYKIDDEATEESHPIVWRPEIIKRKVY